MTDRQRRTQVRTAIGFGVLVALVILGAVVSNALRSKPSVRPTEQPTGIASNTCAGPKPSPPFRDPGPFDPPPSDTTDPELIYVATISTYCGDLVFKIDPLEAPEAARAFIFLAREKFYDSLEIDRVEPGVGLFGGKGNPGFGVVVPRRGATIKRRDLVLLDLDRGSRTLVGAPFAISDGGAIDGVRLGAPPDGDAIRRNDETVARFFDLLRRGPATLPAMYVVHVDIQEFTRT